MFWLVFETIKPGWPMRGALFNPAGINQLFLRQHVPPEMCWITRSTQNSLVDSAQLRQRKFFTQKSVRHHGIFGAFAQPPGGILNNFSVMEAQSWHWIGGKPRPR